MQQFWRDATLQEIAGNSLRETKVVSQSQEPVARRCQSLRRPGAERVRTNECRAATPTKDRESPSGASWLRTSNPTDPRPRCRPTEHECGQDLNGDICGRLPVVMVRDFQPLQMTGGIMPNNLAPAAEVIRDDD